MSVSYEKFDTKKELYDHLSSRISELCDDEDDFISALANASALLALFLDDVNWVGFYLAKKGRLILGPFQGKPAVTIIEPGKGVCGTALVTGETQLVSDVHKCENHIVCDPDSSSEIVVPLLAGGKVIGVLDIDSPLASRFDEDDREGLENFVKAMLPRLNCCG